MKIFIVLLAGVLLSGCVDYQQPSSILPMGASRAEVESIIGPPRSKSRDGSLTTWNYGDGSVCVFKDGRLVASNLSSAPRYSSSLSVGTILPPVSVNIVPAPYYSSPIYTSPSYYGWGGWALPWGGYGWGMGYARPYYGGYYRGYNNYHNNYYRGNYYRGNYYRGNYYRGNWNRGSHH